MFTAVLTALISIGLAYKIKLAFDAESARATAAAAAVPVVVPVAAIAEHVGPTRDPGQVGPAAIVLPVAPGL
jgi:hypothetical protein